MRLPDVYHYLQRRGSRILGAGGVALTILGCGSLLWATGGGAAATTNGVATVMDAGLNAALSGPQASTTTFGISLPPGAVCSGDTASNGFKVVSYMIPRSVYGANGASLQSAVTFTGGNSNVGLFLVDTTGNPLQGANAKNTAPVSGQVIGVAGPWGWSPGLVPDLIPLVDANAVTSPYQTGLITSATDSEIWELGIACINPAGSITDWWNAEITVTGVPTGTGAGHDPNCFTWTPTASSTSGSTTTTSSGLSTTSSTSGASSTTSPSSTSTSTTRASTTSTTSTTTHPSSTTTTARTCTTSTTSPSSTSTSSPTTTSASSTSTTGSTTSTTSLPSTTVGSSCVTTTSTTASPGASPLTTLSGGASVAGVGNTSSNGAIDPVSTGLATTGDAAAAKVGAGMGSIAFGLMLLGLARRRREIERLAWPD